MRSENTKKGYITYRTVIELTDDGSVTNRDETSYSGECMIETDDEGRIVCAFFEEDRGAGTSVEPAVSNTLRIHEGSRVSFTRKGPMSSEFVFDEQGSTTARVDTPYGSMELELATRRADIVSGPGRTDILIEYYFKEAPSDRHTISLGISC